MTLFKQKLFQNYNTVFWVIYQEEILCKSSTLRLEAHSYFKIDKIQVILTIGKLKNPKNSEQNT